MPDLPVFHSRLTLAEGFKIEVYASGIPHPRMLRVTPSGDLLVTQPRKGRVLLLSRDADGDGQSDGMRVLMQDLHLPHGIELKSDWLYIGLADAILRVGFDSATGRLRGSPERIVELPKDNHHHMRVLRFGPDGWLYYAIGAFCNHCEATGSRDQSILRVRPDGTGCPRTGNPESERGWEPSY